jgi:hypothetical protein
MRIIAEQRVRKEKQKFTDGSVLDTYVHHSEYPLELHCALINVFCLQYKGLYLYIG